MKTICYMMLTTFLIISLGYSDDEWISVDEFRNTHIYAIIIDSYNNKWVKSNTKEDFAYDIFKYDNNEWSKKTDLLQTILYDRLQGITVDKNDILYFGSERYVSTYNNDNGEIISYEIPYEEDEFGELVIITKSAGDIYVDSNNTKWIAFKGDFHYSAMLMTFQNGIFQPLKEISVNEITSDSQNNIWLARWATDSYAGLYMYNGSDFYEYAYSDSEKVSFNDVAIDIHNTKWLSAWVGSTDYSPFRYIGLISFIDGEWTLYSQENSALPSNNIEDIAIDHNNIKWIGTDSGLARFDGENWEVFTTKNSGLVNNHVRCLAVEENNTLWIGTKSGLCKYTGDIITAVDEEPKPEALPTITAYPNPFNPSTTISFMLPESGHASITIYNLAGQKVRTLMDEPMAAGNHTIVWDGRDDAGNAVAAGVYVTRLTAGESVATGKMALVK